MDDDFFANDSDNSGTDLSQHGCLVNWLVRFILRLQAKYYISDAAISALLKFLSAFFLLLGRFTSIAAKLAEVLPHTLHSVRNYVGYNIKFSKLVVCPVCHKSYTYDSCTEKCGSIEKTRHCNHVKYPRHPWSSGRSPCGAPLLKSVEMKNGKKFLYPFKVYCYRSIVASLQDLLERPGFFDACSHWKNCSSADLSDIYGGNIWRDFQVFSGKPFLASLTGIGLILNIDWFQPFVHTVYSVGVIYLVIMNLPRTIRFKRENIIIVGIIPGPSEPSHESMNHYLKPLVKELNELWKGVNMIIYEGTTKVSKTIRGALLCCACDLPAGRKVCGFLGHSASLGCSKCLKSFSGSVGTMNYSGFDRTLWNMRTNESHRKDIEEVQKATTKTSRAEMESQLGCRYSILLDLEYFDPPRMLSIDPMHNLFLGTAKHILSVWVEKEFLSRSQFKDIQAFVDCFITPSDIGRIPRKIETGFAGFTADQFKNWVTIFSIPSLYDLIPAEHLECWRHFVIACRILCKQTLSRDNIILVDALLIQFCKKVEILYGEEVVTPNMHLHGHLKEIISDFGPVYEFWLFTFERFNGILGNQPNNNRLIEPQLLNRFLRDNFAFSSDLPLEFQDNFMDLMPQMHSVGSVRDTLIKQDSYTLGNKCTKAVFSDNDISNLKILLAKLYSCQVDEVDVCSSFHKYQSCKIKMYNYQASISKPCIAFASWNTDLFGPPPSILPNSSHPLANNRPVNIYYFAKVNAYLRGSSEVSSKIIAYVDWPKPHPNRTRIGRPVEIWCHNLNECFGMHTFLPLDNILCRCATGIKLVDSENVLVIVPLTEVEL